MCVASSWWLSETYEDDGFSFFPLAAVSTTTGVESAEDVAYLLDKPSCSVWYPKFVALPITLVSLLVTVGRLEC